MGLLDGRVAAVTGAGRGIGRAIAITLAREGARVVVNDPGVAVDGSGRAWTERPFSFHGRRFQFEEVSVYPQPAQQPHPPVWLAAWTSAGVRRAARVADGWLTDPIHGIDAIANLAAEYRKAAHEAGKEPFIVLMRQFAVAEDSAKAAALYGEMVANVWRYYWRSGSFNLELEPAWQRIGDPGSIALRMVAPKRVPFGDPEECLRGFKEWIEAVRPQYVIAVPTPSAEESDAVKHGLRLFGEAVLPRLPRLALT